MITPPAKVRKPFALWDGSCDFSERPICTIPNPKRIIPIARISPKINSYRLLTTARGSFEANTVMLQVRVIMSVMYAPKIPLSIHVRLILAVSFFVFFSFLRLFHIMMLVPPDRLSLLILLPIKVHHNNL